MLTDLSDLVKVLERRPVVVLGNIIPASFAAEAIDLFSPVDALVCDSYGERPLAALCRSLYRPAEWSSIAGFVRRSAPREQKLSPSALPDVVHPDDGLHVAAISRSKLPSDVTTASAPSALVCIAARAGRVCRSRPFWQFFNAWRRLLARVLKGSRSRSCP